VPDIPLVPEVPDIPLVPAGPCIGPILSQATPFQT
jgi:hypothetical protein